jgi:hypothetical protein
MARPLRVPNPENATIEELKQVSRVGSNQTATKNIRSNVAMKRWFVFFTNKVMP